MLCQECKYVKTVARLKWLIDSKRKLMIVNTERSYYKKDCKKTYAWFKETLFQKNASLCVSNPFLRKILLLCYFAFKFFFGLLKRLKLFSSCLWLIDCKNCRRSLKRHHFQKFLDNNDRWRQSLRLIWIVEKVATAISSIPFLKWGPSSDTENWTNVKFTTS